MRLSEELFADDLNAYTGHKNSKNVIYWDDLYQYTNKNFWEKLRKIETAVYYKQCLLENVN
jgi:hypothetical protein